jgi:PKD repeat protein
MGYKRDVFEYNHIETQNWPYDPTKPNPYNYMDNLPQSEWSKMCWAWRIALTYCNELYGAHNTSKDVAVQDNKGEVFLFHPYPGAWFGNVVSASGLTTTLRTDGIVEGQSMTLMNYETPPEMPGGTPVPDGGWWGSIDSQVDTGELIVDSLVRIVIVSGKGMGQYRRIIGHTTSTVTLDRPWLVQPDSSSVAMIARLYADNVLYKNEINAFPPGYKRSTDASMGVGAGDAWALSLEGNVSRRTSTGIGISPSQVTPVCWNEMRDEKAYDCAKSGFDMFTLMVPRSQPGPGPLTSIGNVFRGGEINVVGGTTANGAITGVYIDNGIGTTIENVSIYGKRAVELGGINGPAPMGTILSTSPYGSMMLRKCSVTADSNPVLSPGTPQPMYIDYFNDGQFLSRNTYAGSTQAYWGVGGYQLPVALTKCARFDGYIGGHFDPVVVPIVNAGMQTYSWTASPSDSWITATIGASPTVFGESDSGRLVISVNTTGMSAGEHWGYVTVTAGAKTIKVGVCVDLAAAAPAQLSPIASFTATPPGGIAPVTSEFDAGASSDPDGAIVSYSWDFGDGTAASGVTASHTYSTPGIYLVTLTVIDNSGRTGTAVASITATAPLTAVNVSGNPNPPASAGAVVALTASAVGGYNVNYKFLQRSGNAWSTLRDYGTAPSINWTVPSTPGYYAIRVLARNATSTNAYDVMGEIAYPVGLVPTDGMRLWLRGDSGIGFDDQGKVASWADQSGAGNNVSQSTDSKKPSLVTAAFDGKPAVRFAGPDQMLQSSGLVLTGNTSFTTFTVASPTSVVPNVYQFLWWNGAASSTAGYGCYIHSTDLKLKCAWGPDTYWMTDSTSALAGKWYKMSTRYTPGNYQGWLNGLFLTTKTYALSNFNGGGFFSVGNMGPSPAQGFYGDIGEILIYNRALTDTERANVESYILSKWSSVPAVAKDRLSDVKALSDQMVVSITGAKVVTAATGIFAGGVSYIEEPDRTCGLKLTGAAVSAWENVTLTGTMGTDSCGERVLQVSSVDSRASGTELGTLGMMNKTLTASGQLVRVWGRVTEAGEGYFVLNDGSGSPVRIDTGGLVSPITVNIQSGQYAAATGLAGKGAGGVTVVRPRSDSDVRVY